MPKKSSEAVITQVRPDAKGRIALGKIAEGVSSFIIYAQAGGTYILEPMVEIPARERWLLESKDARDSISRGLEQSANGNVRSIGSFAKHAKEPIIKDE